MTVKCIQCQGEIVFGSPHEMNVNGEPTFWCEDCIEQYSEAMWPEDIYGPRTPKMLKAHPTKQ